jgi:hypothetical protein
MHSHSSFIRRRQWHTRQAAAGASGSPVLPILHDDFTDADSTALADHTIAPIRPGTAVWTAYASAHQITSNAARNASSAVTINAAECSQADVTILLSFRMNGSSSHGGAAFRLSDANNHWRAFCSTTAITIQDAVAGTVTTRASTLITLNALTWYDLVITAIGTAITITQGANTLSYSSSFNQTATQHGPYTRRGMDLVDNFKVYAS